MFDIKVKLATAELKAKHERAGMIPDGELSPEISDFEACIDVVKSVAESMGCDPFAMILGMRCFNETPPPNVTANEFDDMAEASDYVRRMSESYGVKCIVVPCGRKRFKIEEVKA